MGNVPIRSPACADVCLWSSRGWHGGDVRRTESSSPGRGVSLPSNWCRWVKNQLSSRQEICSITPSSSFFVPLQQCAPSAKPPVNSETQTDRHDIFHVAPPSLFFYNSSPGLCLPFQSRTHPRYLPDPSPRDHLAVRRAQLLCMIYEPKHKIRVKLGFLRAQQTSDLVCSRREAALSATRMARRALFFVRPAVWD